MGKTSLVRRFVEGLFDDRYLSTIGVKVSRKTLERPTGTLNLLVWDLAGGDDIRRPSSYLQGAAGAFIVCDLTRRETLATAQHHAAQMRALNDQTPLVLVANKVDLRAEQGIPESDLRATSEILNCPYLFTSAKTGEQVEAAFAYLAEQLEARL